MDFFRLLDFFIFSVFFQFFSVFLGFFEIFLDVRGFYELKKDFNTEIEGLFNPKKGVRISNPQRIPWIFWICFYFSNFFGGVRGFS